MSKIIINATKTGRLEFIYDDRLRRLIHQGKATITRASHVEPGPEPDLNWYADMSPSGGEVLGPFSSRKEALEAEVEWVNSNVLTTQTQGCQSDKDVARGTASS